MAPPTFPSSYDPNHPNEAIVPLPNSPLVTISKDSSPYTLSYQSPLTHRGKGPGLILFEPPKPSTSNDKDFKKANTLDPLPYFKWAEEGYAIAQIGNDLDVKDIEIAFKEAVELLDREDNCNVKEKYAILGTFN